MKQHVVIAGGGLAGLTLALALRRALAGCVEVTLADPALAREPSDDGRAFAVAAAGRRMLEALGVWGTVAPAAQAIEEMIVTDSRTRDVVRPVYLTFAREREGEPFAHMIMNAALSRALIDACRGSGVALRAASVSGMEAAPGGGLARVSFGDGGEARAALLVAADGKRSALREAAGIGWVGWDYGQSGIVATIRHERPHGGRACEHFMPGGPFAILPLPDDEAGRHRSSIVWTEPTRDAATYVALPAVDFAEELESRFGHALGAIEPASAPRAWPLSFGMARAFVGPRLALAGDAAHVVHPIAGQGLNLGLQDVAALADAVAAAARLGLDIGSAEALRPYERARRAATVAMGVVTDGLNRLFSNDLAPVRLARDLGLGVVDRLPGVKGRLIGEAAGWREGAPRLTQGLLP